LDNDCEYVVVKCSLEGCSHELPRRDLGQHLKDCDYREVPCQYCGEGVVFIDMDKHVSACDSVPVPCPHGCKDNILRGNLTQHEDTCTHMALKCLHEGCSHEVKRRDLGQHMKDCDYRDVPCEYCGEDVIFVDMDEHVSACDSVPVPCPRGCKDNILRGNLTQHEQVCSMAIVSCPFAGIGCDHGHITRESLSSHMEKFQQRHMTMMGERLLEQQQVNDKKIDALKKKIARLSLENSKFSLEINQLTQQKADLKNGTAKLSWIIKGIRSKLNANEFLNEFSKMKTIIVPKVGACSVRLQFQSPVTDYLGLYVIGATLPSKVCLDETSVRILKKDGTVLEEMVFSNMSVIEGSGGCGWEQFIRKVLLESCIWDDGSLHIEVDLVLSAVEDNCDEREEL
jgi:hypothetical protein